MASPNGDLLILGYDGFLEKYTSAGTVVNSSLITGLQNPEAIAVLFAPAAPAFTSVSRAGDTLNLMSAVIGQTYQLQYGADLHGTNWGSLGGPITATNSTAAASDAIGATQQRFYRLLVVP